MSERTEIEVLEKIEYYSRETMKNSARTARNAIFIGWVAIASVAAAVFLSIYK